MRHFHGQAHFKLGLDIEESTLHPDATYWMNGAKGAYEKLIRLLGSEDKAFQMIEDDGVWNIDHTWKEICLSVEKLAEKAEKTCAEK